MATDYYAENMDKIQALVKQISREYLRTTDPQESLMQDSAYLMNFVVGSGGEDFEEDLADRLKELMKEVTGGESTETL